MNAKRWFPLMVPVLSAAGLVEVIATAVPLHWVGMMLLTTAQGLSAVAKQMGPLRQASLWHPEDERETLWRERVNLNSFAIVSVVAMIGTGTFGGWMFLAAFAGWSVPPLAFGMKLIAFAMFLFTLFMVLPTLFAGWTLPETIEDETEGRLSFLKPRRHP